MRISDWSSDVVLFRSAVDGQQDEIADQAMGIAIAEAMPLKGLNHEPGKKRHHYATKERSRQAIATGDRDAEQEQRPKQQMLPRQHAEQIGDHVGTQVAGIVENAEYATKIMGAT